MILGSPGIPHYTEVPNPLPPGLGLLVLSRADDEQDWLPVLDMKERGRVAGFRHDLSRAQFIVGRGLTKALMAELLGLRADDVDVATFCRFCGRRDHGKPYVDWPGAPHFSLAHSGGYVLVGVTQEGPLGVDLEVVRPMPDLDWIGRSILTLEERREFERLDPDAALSWFVERWCMKEAAAKKSGLGLATDFSCLETIGSTGIAVLLPLAPVSPPLLAAVALPLTVRRLAWVASPSPPS